MLWPFNLSSRVKQLEYIMAGLLDISSRTTSSQQENISMIAKTLDSSVNVLVEELKTLNHRVTAIERLIEDDFGKSN